MQPHWAEVAMAVGIAMGLLGCASGDGVPKAKVRNSFTVGWCVVEAQWIGPQNYEFGWDTPLPSGEETPTRELTVGTGYGYAVVKQATDCLQAAREPGGTMYKTKNALAMNPGQVTVIEFSTDTADQVPADPSKFPRLSGDDSAAPDSAASDAPAGD
jgi:hypothetical protein